VVDVVCPKQRQSTTYGQAQEFHRLHSTFHSLVQLPHTMQTKLKGAFLAKSETATSSGEVYGVFMKNSMIVTRIHWRMGKLKSMRIQFLRADHQLNLLQSVHTMCKRSRRIKPANMLTRNPIRFLKFSWNCWRICNIFLVYPHYAYTEMNIASESPCFMCGVI
jgi:hypothetical protein